MAWKETVLGDLSKLKVRASQFESTVVRQDTLSILRVLILDEYIPMEGIESIRELYDSHQYVHPLSLRNEL